MKRKRLSKKDIEDIIKYHSQGLTNGKIGKLINIPRYTVRYHLIKNNKISNGRKMQPINKINDYEAICSKCNKIKPIDEFQKGRKDKQYEYHFSYCNSCRKKQLYLSINDDVNKFLNDRYNRLKLRAEKNNIPFDIIKKDFIELYYKQKGLCFYSDKPLICKAGIGYSRMSFSVDKIESDLGYTIDNIVFCGAKFNTIKSDLTLKEMKKWMPVFYKRIIKKINKK